MKYLWAAAQVSMGNKFLANQNFEELTKFIAVLEVPDKWREVVEAPKSDLVAASMLWPDTSGLVPQHYLSHHSHTLLTQNLLGESIFNGLKKKEATIFLFFLQIQVDEQTEYLHA